MFSPFFAFTKVVGINTAMVIAAVMELARWNVTVTVMSGRLTDTACQYVAHGNCGDNVAR